MHRFDFLSGAPKTFIFQKDSNKTNLGGIFTIIFLLVIFVIIYSYLYEYFANPKYNVSYYYHEEYYDDDERDEKFNDTNLYPELEYNLQIYPEYIRKSLLLATMKEDGKFHVLEPKKTYKKQVSKLNFYVFYKCSNKTDCSFRGDDKDKESSPFNIFDLVFEYMGYSCDHQNPDSPIKRHKEYYEFHFPIISNTIELFQFNWKTIKYEEESSLSGMFRRTDEYYGGKFYNHDKYSLPLEEGAFPLIPKTEDNQTDYYLLV